MALSIRPGVPICESPLQIGPGSRIGVAVAAGPYQAAAVCLAVVLAQPLKPGFGAQLGEHPTSGDRVAFFVRGPTQPADGDGRRQEYAVAVRVVAQALQLPTEKILEHTGLVLVHVRGALPLDNDGLGLGWLRQ